MSECKYALSWVKSTVWGICTANSGCCSPPEKMATDDIKPEFKTALELASNNADAWVYCATCEGATAHRDESDGTRSCYVCDVDDEEEQ